jgi:F-type H+-transporting ATPase subunit gamma
MSNLEKLRRRMRGVRATRKVTSAMKVVAASKLKRAKDAQEASKPYSSRMHYLIKHILGALENEFDTPALLKGTTRDDIILILVISSDRGLCGAFNGSIIRKAISYAKEMMALGKEVRFFCVGKKAVETINKYYSDLVVYTATGIVAKKLDFVKIQDLVEKLIELFEEGKFDRCMVIYSHFISAISQEVTSEQFLPIDDHELQQSKNNSGIVSAYDFEPSKATILSSLIPKHLAVRLYYIFLENIASEHGARMTAMENATKNAGEMISKLTLLYNRTRQAAITKELIEIISGAQAV